MSSLKLIYFDIHANEVKYANDFILSVKEFADIWNQNVKVKGDADGSKKLYAKAVMRFISFMVHHRSLQGAFDDNTRLKKCAEDAGLYIIDKNFYPDDIIRAAIAKYEEIIYTYLPSAQTLIQLQRGLKFVNNTIEGYNHQLSVLTKVGKKMMSSIEKAIDAPNTFDTEDALIEKMTKLTAINDNVNSIIKEFLDISLKIPKALDSIESTLDKVLKEEAQIKKLPGDKEKGNREDPR